MPELFLSGPAQEGLRRLEAEATLEPLVTRVNEALDLIEQHPRVGGGKAAAVRRSAILGDSGGLQRAQLRHHLDERRRIRDMGRHRGRCCSVRGHWRQSGRVGHRSLRRSPAPMTCDPELHRAWKTRHEVPHTKHSTSTSWRVNSSVPPRPRATAQIWAVSCNTERKTACIR